MGRNSVLHDEIVSFAAKLAPTPQETEQWEKTIELLRKIIYETFSHDVELSPFGSYANGLCARGSDLDLVITGLLKPDTPEGFFGSKQVLVWDHLEVLQQRLNEEELLNAEPVQFIKRAKVPILKVTMANGTMIDISINDETSVRAANYVLEKVRQCPPLRPLCLVLKAFLKAYNLSEVKKGGLGGFALTNMVMAHIQECFKAKKDMRDYGDLLITFFRRFGQEFDPDRQAVSVAMGGIVSKKWVKTDLYQRHSRNYGSRRSTDICWFIENPVTQKNVAQGSYNVYLVRNLFNDAYSVLKSPVKGESSIRSLFNLLEVTP